MSEFKHFHPGWHHKLNIVMLSVIFITVGVLLLGRNLGWVDPTIFSFIVSWQMLLIVLGVIHLIKQHFIGGGLLIFIGGYFLFPQLTVIGGEWIGVYWPVIFILIGILILIKRWNHKPGFHFRKNRKTSNTSECTTTDGFVSSEVSFGAVEHIMLDPVFKGADLHNSFGSIVLDLRRTKLEAEETIINVDCSFGSIELIIPVTWNISIVTDNTLSGVSDKRLHPYNAEIDTQHRVIIKGDLSFSGVEIKS